MKLFLVLSLLYSTLAMSQSKVDTFVIEIQDRSMKVSSPEKKKPFLTVLVENRSLSDQVGKFMVKGKNLKFVSIASGKSETVEIENKSGGPVYFVPLSPAFQDVELIFGKKAYEIPSKE